jgi:YihY family inner membrane protein
MTKPKLIPKIKAWGGTVYERSQITYKRINKRTGGVLGILRHAAIHFVQARGAEAASALSFTAFFSIFPMIIAVISIGSYFLDIETVKNMVFTAIASVIPNATEVINTNIDNVIKARGVVSVVALLALIWTTTSLFNLVVININRAFSDSHTPKFLSSRLFALLLMIILGGLFILSLVASTFSELMPTLNLETVLWRIFALLVPVVIKFLLFWGMYRWIPRVSVKHKAAAISALVTAIAWELVTNAFTWYLGSSTGAVNLIYGSLWAIVALMFWIYLTGMIIIFGAHLAYAIDSQIKYQEKLNADAIQQQSSPA